MHSHRVRKNISSLACGWLLLLYHSAFALPEDKKEVMQLSSSTADINQESHLGIYSGHVRLDQGTTHLRAEKAITKVDSSNKLEYAIAEGSPHNPAHVWTTVSLDKPELHAYADKIYYYPNKHLIELQGHAKIEQGKDSIQAAKLRIDTLSQHLISSRDEQQGTIITIYPEKKT